MPATPAYGRFASIPKDCVENRYNSPLVSRRDSFLASGAPIGSSGTSLLCWLTRRGMLPFRYLSFRDQRGFLTRRFRRFHANLARILFGDFGFSAGNVF